MKYLMIITVLLLCYVGTQAQVVEGVPNIIKVDIDDPIDPIDIFISGMILTENGSDNIVSSIGNIEYDETNSTITIKSKILNKQYVYNTKSIVDNSSIFDGSGFKIIFVYTDTRITEITIEDNPIKYKLTLN
jgi:hypothetical protein